MKQLVFIFLVLLTCIFPFSVFAGFLDKDNSAKDVSPGIMVGEVCGYVDYPVTQEFLDAFEDVLKEQIENTKEFRLEVPVNTQEIKLRGILTSINTVLSHIHMNAIAKGGNYQRGEVSAALLRYTDDLYGYKYQPAKREKNRKNIAEYYKLSQYLEYPLQELREKYNISYLLFCNVKQVNARRNNSATSHKMDVNIDYYLVDTVKGRVYEESNFSDKSVQSIEIPVYFRYSKTSSPNQMLHDVLEAQANRIVKDIITNGIKALKKEK